MLKDKTIIVGVCGGIAAYKACDVVSKLTQAGAEVWVTVTKEAAQLVTPLTFRTLSRNPVILDLFADELAQIPVPHISITDRADLFMIIPATANIIGKIAQGIADDPLTTMLMAATCPKVLCPAMNNNMWNNPLVQENVNKLNKLGYKFLGPEVGHLACEKDDIGRMVEPQTIIDAAIKMLSQAKDLDGQRILVTAGPTYEDLDPVRFIGNRSSGKMGYALAQAAAERGAEVTLISGPTKLTPPENVKLIQVKSALDMQKAVLANFKQTDSLIMAAAVSDFAPEKMQTQKIKKGKSKSRLVKLSKTPDILADLRKIKGKKKIIGFAAETENLMAGAKQKLKDKGLDFIVANDVSRTDIGFDSDYNEVKIISRQGQVFPSQKLPKLDVANIILDHVR
ncbi:MAG: bifunctional phosphopantothenoylcysteine decarboxylase/phosphopantothenate--cysteine ligase CoaBC [Candidatus Margulisbacteria bacterium]|nr:bifunctional phosphopantothenoylcysteine decarboxylase/phosphopantothenate--cysteine ligase CoaBC [Candidatus Margulisiibacteriota bacterium]MBU1021769.1 bifunctional phosphopantothenoylcysteine decarboxylase/phosphopantothenate--cysteine ligase CoaBC [Candidatus Margulisiibacteriota bacterium]MBU1729515.1 bifunctional phosphopantothenoylcysteine decarboxylase/phosphopantothenate--cysteine ligase CoaBC [Candidatus Margulisiibacteriota bacterium]MBU1955384.1 bifunctional phosphopantothenoylcys